MGESHKPELTARQLAELNRRMHEDQSQPRAPDRTRDQPIKTGHAVNMQRVAKGLQRC